MNILGHPCGSYSGLTGSRATASTQGKLESFSVKGDRTGSVVIMVFVLFLFFVEVAVSEGLFVLTLQGQG